MIRDKLVIITAHYPYGHGEQFLQEELRIASSKFSEILVFSLEKNPKSKMRYVPDNCVVIKCRKNGISFHYLILSIIQLFRLSVFRELIFSITKYKNRIISSLRKILTDEYISNILANCFSNTALNYSQTIFYSYWLSSSAMYLVKLKKQHPEGVYISRAHGGDCFFERGYQSYRREIISGLDAIYSISNAGAENLKINFGEYCKNGRTVRVSRLGVIKKDDCVNPFIEGNEKITLVSCSNVICLKRLDLIIDILCMIDFCQVSWIHFGGWSTYG